MKREILGLGRNRMVLHGLQPQVDVPASSQSRGPRLRGLRINNCNSTGKQSQTKPKT